MTTASAAGTPQSIAPPLYARKQPPLPAQILLGGFLHGGFAPLVWTLEKLGGAPSFFAFASRGRRKEFERKNPFRGYTPGPQDVFVMTFAKSGTNWMMQIAHQLIWHARAEYDHIHCAVPWPDTKVMGGPLSRYAIALEDAVHWQWAPERKRVIKTHFDWDLLPYSGQARYIAVIRDPKDIFVSSYFFLRDGLMGPAMPSLETWYKLFLSRDFLIGGSWAVNTASYWAQRQRPNVLVMSFKEMKRDLRGSVVKVADFLDIHAGGSIVDEVCRQSSFGYMKQMDHKFAMGQLIPWMKPGAMIRKGTQGGSAELLTPGQQREMDAYFQAELQRLGSDFPYEEFCDLAR